MKISVIGAGNVGATCAQALAQRDFVNEVILLDIKEGVAEGKALDMCQRAPIDGYSTMVKGVTNDYTATENSEVIIITSGIPRKPGMSRDDLISTNAKIVKSVTEASVAASPDAKIIVVANPLDVMTYTSFLASKKKPNEVMGMAGILDISRYKAFIGMELGVSVKEIQALLLGGHGDTMVPLPRFTSVAGIPVTSLISEERLTAIVERTKKGGGELVKLMGTSAWYAPGTAAAQMAEAIVKNENRIFPAAAWLTGEYGQNDVFLGVPVQLGKNGIEKIIDVKLNDDEQALLNTSSEHVKAVMKVLDDMAIF